MEWSILKEVRFKDAHSSIGHYREPLTPTPLEGIRCGSLKIDTISNTRHIKACLAGA